MIPLTAATAAAAGTHLLFTAAAFGWRGFGAGPTGASRWHQSVNRRRLLEQARFAGLERRTALAALAGVTVAAAATAFALSGSLLVAVALGVAAGMAPVVTARARRRAATALAHEAWPRLIEEVRVLTASAGRSIPGALLDAGDHAPIELQMAFAAARREWLLTTDFERTVGVLKQILDDPTADAACETLLVAHQVGGADVDRRLAALAEDRREEVQCRRDARARQAGVRFARRFVLLVPLGMAAAGSSLGSGIAAYQTAGGLVAVSAGVVVIALCWVWSGRLLMLPDEERVLA